MLTEEKTSNDFNLDEFIEEIVSKQKHRYEKSDNCRYVPNQASVCFKSSVDVSELEEVEGHPVLKKDLKLNSVLIEVTDLDLVTYIEYLNGKDNVHFADFNLVGEGCDIIPTDPNWAHQWGHREINCPKAWERRGILSGSRMY